PAAPLKLTITSASDEARAAALACADAVDNYRLDTAREKCADAIAKDPQLALAHALLAEATLAPDAARKSLMEAQAALEHRAVSEGERLLVGGVRAMREGKLSDARRLLDALCGMLAGELRAFFYRGRLRQRVGDLEGALADYTHASELDGKYGPA